MMINLHSAQTSMEKWCSWHIWGSLPDVRQWKTQTGEKTKRWMMVQSLVWKQVSLEFPAKSRRRLRVSQHLRSVFQTLGPELKKDLKPSYFLVWFSSTLRIWRQDWEDDWQGHGVSKWWISSWRNCGAVPLKWLYTSERLLCQYDPSLAASGDFSRQAWCLSVSQSLLLCSAQVEDSTVPNLAAPMNSYCSNPALVRLMQQQLKSLSS